MWSVLFVALAPLACDDLPTLRHVTRVSDGSGYESWRTANEVCAQVESSLGGTCSETMVHMREPMAVEYRYMCGYHAEDPSTCIVYRECGSPRRGEDVLSLFKSLLLQRKYIEDAEEDIVEIVTESERNHAFAVSQLYQLYEDMQRTVRRADGILVDAARNGLLLLFLVTLVSTMLVCTRRPRTVVVDAAPEAVESVQVAEPHSKV